MSSPDKNYYVGKTLGRYQLHKFIGAGAFAWVYYAYSHEGQAVAIKIQYSPAEDAVQRFSREIKVMRELPQSPYCISYHDDGFTPEGLPYLVMEFVDGATVKDTLKHKPVWAPEEACHLMVQLCDAFAGLHQLGLAHRDVKPENIMLTRDWQVKLMDFGLVKDAQGLLKLYESEDIVQGSDFAENIDKGVLAGTPEYMAPEQFSDASHEDESQTITDTWTDVYSLGLIFYELLTGKKLFPLDATAKNQQEYARNLLAYLKQRTEFRDEMLSRPPMVPAPLWSIIERSLKQDPKLRQRNAAELGQHVQRYLDTGQGVVVEDEDATSAIDLADFLASYEGLGGSSSPKPPAAQLPQPVPQGHPQQHHIPQGRPQHQHPQQHHPQPQQQFPGQHQSNPFASPSGAMGVFPGPPQEKGMSTGVLIGIIVGAVVVVGVVVVVLVL